MVRRERARSRTAILDDAIACAVLKEATSSAWSASEISVTCR
jgi:hypothetical protein